MMEKEFEMTFSVLADCVSDKGIVEYMESMEKYFYQVTQSLVQSKVIEEPEMEFLWQVREIPDEDEPNYEPDYDVEDVLEIPKQVYQQMDKLVAETRLAIKTPLLKHDLQTQGLYNGMEQIMALLDGREPRLVDRYGNIEGSEKK